MTTTVFKKEPNHSHNVPNVPNYFSIPVREWSKVHNFSQMMQSPVSLYPLGEIMMPYTSIPDEYRQPFELALQILHSVHGLGTDVLEQIPIVFTQEKHLGGYEYIKSTSSPNRFIFRQGKSPTLVTIIHEIAHALDHQVIGEKFRFASESTDLVGAMDLLDVMRSIRESEAFRVVEQYRVGQVINGVVLQSAKIEYHRDPREWFAKAYVQLIALASSNDELLKFIESKHLDSKQKIVYPESWSSKDFQPIYKAFLQLLLKKRWIHHL